MRLRFTFQRRTGLTNLVGEMLGWRRRAQTPGEVVRRRALGRRCSAERSDRGQQLAAMADRGHADADQVVGRQLRQHLGVDVVVAERLLVLLEPQTAQPGCDVHHCLA